VIFKIAAGVFLGITVVLIFLQIPTWLKESKEERAMHVVIGLTPQVVISRCGKPIGDKTEKFPTIKPSEFVIVRDMSYKGGTGNVVLTFGNVEEDGKQERWSLNSMKDSVDGFVYSTGMSKLIAVPCLDSK